MPLLAACGESSPERERSPAESSALPAQPSARAPSRTFALLVNGGGRPEKNYRSHLQHVREMADVLVANGVPREHIAIFLSDGDDPAPDLAVRDAPRGDDFWLIDDLWLGRALRGELRLEDSRLDGQRVRPATRAALSEWIRSQGRGLAAGDTLLFYVTDHGTKNPRDLDNNRIVLWGEGLSVDDLRALLAELPEGVRVVALMSQCYSGSFANAIWPGRHSQQVAGDRCGFYSSSRERPAYGCYAENRDVDNVGHSFRFIEALRSGVSFLEAHEQVVLSDRTPDVPNRSSDLWLRRLLEAEAERRELGYDELVEELLAEAWRDPAQFAPELYRLERMAQVFGTFAPRRLAELDEQLREIPSLGEEFDDYAERWTHLLRDLKQRNLQRFVRDFPEWRERLDAQELRRLDDAERARLVDELLPELSAATAGDPELFERIEHLRTVARAAREAAYRMEVRRAALQRMRLLLERIAGLTRLARSGDSALQAELAALEACEGTALGERPSFDVRDLPLPPPFPPLQSELATLDLLLPGWIGLEYARVEPAEQREYGLLPGAVRVERVERGSPADRAGLRPGDIVLGPPDAPFREPYEIREWTMTSVQDEVRALEILRYGERVRVDVETGSAPSP